MGLIFDHQQTFQTRHQGYRKFHRSVTYAMNKVKLFGSLMTCCPEEEEDVVLPPFISSMRASLV